MKKILIIALIVFMAASLSAFGFGGLGGGGSLVNKWIKLTGDADGIALYLNNDQWIVGRNNADDAWLNMFKMNTSDQIEVGSEILLGNSFWGDDPGVAVANYFTISGTGTDTHGLVLVQGEGVNILTVTGDNDGSGAIENELVTIDGDLTVTGQITGTASLRGEMGNIDGETATEVLAQPDGTLVIMQILMLEQGIMDGHIKMDLLVL